MKIQIKPLSVNECWQGRRFKTKAYKDYENWVMLLLPKLEIPEGNLNLTIEYGLSNVTSDIDNPTKPFLDILQKKYGFNDSRIYSLNLKKIKVPKGQEFIKFEFSRC